MNNPQDHPGIRALVESPYQARLLIDPETGRILEASPAAAGFYGHSREVLRSLSAWDLTPSRGPQETLAMLAGIASGQERSPRPDSWHRLASGELRPVMVCAEPFEAEGRVLVLATVLDFAGRARQEEASREASEELWRRALEAAGHGVWDWDVATGAVTFSALWRLMLGYEEGDLRGEVGDWARLVHPEDLDRAMAALQAYLGGETPAYESVHRLLCKDGTWKWSLGRGAVFQRDAAGRPLRMVGTLTDISARKAVEDRLERNERRLRLATEGAELGIWYWDMESRVLEWTERCKAHLALPPGETPSFEHFYAVMHPEDRARVERLLQAAVEGVDEYQAEYRILHPDGTCRWISAPGRVFRGSDGAPLGMGGVTQDITARKEAEAALHVSEEQMRLFIDHAPAALAVFDLDMRYLAASRRWREDRGLGDRDLVGLCHYEVLPEIGGDWREVHQRAMRGETIRTEEDRLERLDGRVEWLRREILPWRRQDGSIGGIAIFSEDITRRKEAEQRLRESERRFRELFEHLPIAYQALDAEGRWLDANPEMARLLGFDSPQELLGLSFADFWEDPTDQGFGAACRGFKRELGLQGELRLRRRDGSPVTVVLAGRVQLDAAGRFVRTHCVLTDITQRRAMEEQVRALNAALEGKVEERTAELVAAQGRLQEALADMVLSEARYRTMFEQSPLGVALIDSLSGEIHEVNDRFAAIAGRTREEMAHIDWMQITHPDDVQEDLDHMARLNAGEISGFHMYKRYLKPDGAPVWISMTVASLRVEAGDRPRHLCLIEDITAQRAQEEELREAKRAADAASAAKSEFLAHMGHEIRTPLNGVLGLAQVLGREDLTDKQRGVVTRIQEAGRSLLVIANDILDLSKIEAGQLRLEVRPFRVEATLDALDSLLGVTARSKGLALTVRGPATSPGLLLGDQLRLEQVLLNLLGNAIKFTSRGEVAVLVEAREVQDPSLRLHFEIRDTGIGIAPEELERLFTPFTQGDVDIARRFGGTGLGLAISRRLVDLMGGEIGVESRVGQGSTFWFELPFQRAPQVGAAPPSREAIPAGPRLSGLHLLVVDDSPVNREVVQHLLEAEGARATQACEGREALELLKARPGAFDAVLMDLRMPVMDGLEATRALRGEPGLGKLPVLVLSAGVVAEKLERARAAGANEVLTKPLDLEQLVAALARWTAPRGETSADRPPAPAAAGLLPTIPGLDRDLAASALGGDLAFFTRLLGQFFDQFADTAEATRRDLARGQREEAARRLHTMRGSAGHLGARDLGALAGALEEALDRGETPGEESLAALERQIAELQGHCAPWLAGSASPPPAGAAPTLEVGRLEELRRALRTRNLAARRLFEGLQPALEGTLGPEVTEEIGLAVSRLRFDEAVDLLGREPEGGGGRAGGEVDP